MSEYAPDAALTGKHYASSDVSEANKNLQNTGILHNSDSDSLIFLWKFSA